MEVLLRGVVLLAALDVALSAGELCQLVFSCNVSFYRFPVCDVWLCSQAC